jgi:cytochrome P450
MLSSPASCADRYLLESYSEDCEEEEEEEKVDPALLLDNLVTLLFGGYDTTSIALSYLLLCLARHPDVEARALAEIRSVLRPGEPPSYEQLTGEFVYCTAVVEEVLRLYPPAPVTVRHLERELTLRRTSEKTWGHPDKEPVTLPAGTAVFLPIWWIHRSELNFHDPLTFDPERFMPENRKHMKRFAFMAFSGGARDCVGRRFAMLELLSLFVNVIRKVKFECVEGFVLEPEKAGVVQKPRGGLPLVVSKR